MHGQFVLVQLETPDEAVLGRIASFSSEGKLSYGSGEEFNIRAVQEDRRVPEDLREQYLKYRVNIRVLGVLRTSPDGTPSFVPSHRRLPHVGSAVAFPSGDVLREVCGHNDEGAKIGHFVLGEYVYTSAEGGQANEDWMRVQEPEICVRFPVSNLVSRRSLVFARAGFGKSNLTKLLFSTLYDGTPSVTKRAGRAVPVGTVIFDPDGEYFWPDDKGRPGLCDVPHLQNNLVVFTERAAPSALYGSFTAGGIKLDIRQLRPSDVISIALAPERQDQQNVAKLRALSKMKWASLVDLIDSDRNAADVDEIGRLLDLKMPNQEAEAIAARSNMSNIVRMLHDKSSQFLGLLLKALEAGKLCVVDVSQMRGQQAFILAGIVLRRIFDRNQDEFTKAVPRTVPTIAVIEEAQTVLQERAVSAEPYIAWVKEGRKYDLGAFLITQQPGAISQEILSQGDNWFIFHLLAATDLASAKRANAHFSDDLLSSLLNEPIPGQGLVWSSVAGRAYPVSMRVLLFEKMFSPRDPTYSAPALETFAGELGAQRQAVLEAAEVVLRADTLGGGDESAEQGENSRTRDDEQDELLDDDDGPDLEKYYRRLAIEAVQEAPGLMDALVEHGAKWSRVQVVIKNALPGSLDSPWDKAYELLPRTMDEIAANKKKRWETYDAEVRGRRTKHIRLADPRGE